MLDFGLKIARFYSTDVLDVRGILSCVVNVLFI